MEKAVVMTEEESNYLILDVCTPKNFFGYAF